MLRLIKVNELCFCRNRILTLLSGEKSALVGFVELHIVSEHLLNHTSTILSVQSVFKAFVMGVN